MSTNRMRMPPRRLGGYPMIGSRDRVPALPLLFLVVFAVAALACAVLFVSLPLLAG